MTIAVCYVSPEGIVLGADSTSSVPNEAGMHFFDFNQKVFEIGENSTLGLLTWGLAGLGVSFRTLVALLDDDLRANPEGSVLDVATRWVDRIWSVYSAFPPVIRVLGLHGKKPWDASITGASAADQRTKQEEEEYETLRTALGIGFCIGGYLLPDRQPHAYEVALHPLGAKPKPVEIQAGWRGWGVPNMISRLLFGYDPGLPSQLLTSGKWAGSPNDLQQLLAGYSLDHATLPIRDAIDFVHSCIHSTIKAMKFSTLPQVCGGPVEVAVITTDRRFRWVRHKQWDAAISDGAI